MPDSSPKMPMRRVVILVFDGVQPIDFSGPAQALITANDEGASPLYLVSVRSLTEKQFRPHPDFRSIPTLLTSI